MTISAVPYSARPQGFVRRIAVAISVLCLPILAACDRNEGAPPGVIASLRDRLVTLEDFRSYVDRNAGTPLGQMPAEAAGALFDQYIDELILSEEAAARGLDVTADEVARAMQNASGVSIVEKRDELRRSRLVSDILTRMPKPTDAEIEQYYQQNAEEFRTSDQVRARQILLHSEDDAKKALAELEKGVAFEQVSKKYSRAPNAARGGDIGFIARGQLPRVFEDAIFNLKAGETSQIVRTDGNFYHIFKVDEVAAAGSIPLSMARPSIEQNLGEERLRSELERVRNDARKRLELTIHPERLGFRYRGKYRVQGE